MNDPMIDIVNALEKEMQCNCDLDNWEPERSTGHSHVCRIHNRALAKYREKMINASFSDSQGCY